jgi:hypothetical protein
LNRVAFCHQRIEVSYKEKKHHLDGRDDEDVDDADDVHSILLLQH